MEDKRIAIDQTLADVQIAAFVNGGKIFIGNVGAFLHDAWLIQAIDYGLFPLGLCGLPADQHTFAAIFVVWFEHQPFLVGHRPL